MKRSDTQEGVVLVCNRIFKIETIFKVIFDNIDTLWYKKDIKEKKNNQNILITFVAKDLNTL